MQIELPLVSIIMPCYNHGAYLMEALESVKKQSYPNYEIILINDGSTDTETLALLDKLSDEATVIHQENAGPSVARHRGIQEAKGKYLFFLDSDNRVKSEYIGKGVAIMEANPKIGIVYSDAEVLGGNRRITKSAFNIYLLVFANNMDLCSVMRKQAYDDTPGFDSYLSKLGLEDWELWFSLYDAGWQFHYIPEVLFDYRVADESRTHQVANKNIDKIVSHIYQKHSKLIFEKYSDLYYENKQRKESIDTRIGGIVLTPYRFLKRLFR